MSRIKSEIWVSGFVRQCSLAGVGVYIAHRGDPDAGVIWVKHAALGTPARLFAPSRDDKGEMGWREVKCGPESEIDEYLDRERRIDEDLWLVEVEARPGQLFFTEPVEELDRSDGMQQ